MKYAADNALGILKNSSCYVIVCRHVAQRQRMIRTKLRFRTRGRRHSRYNRYRLTCAQCRIERAAGRRRNYFSAFNRSSATLASDDNARRDVRFFQRLFISRRNLLERADNRREIRLRVLPRECVRGIDRADDQHGALELFAFFLFVAHTGLLVHVEHLGQRIDRLNIAAMGECDGGVVARARVGIVDHHFELLDRGRSADVPECVRGLKSNDGIGVRGQLQAASVPIRRFES